MSFICHIHNYTEYNQQWNVFSAFNPSKCTHLEQWAADSAAPGEQLGVWCLAQGSHLSRGQYLPELRFEPTTSGYKSDALSIRATTGGRVEKLIAQVVWSPVLSFHSLWWFGVQCHLLVLVHCVFWKPTSLHPFTKKFWNTSCFLLLTSFLKMLISFSSRIWPLPTLPKVPKVG